MWRAAQRRAVRAAVLGWLVGGACTSNGGGASGGGSSGSAGKGSGTGVAGSAGPTGTGGAAAATGAGGLAGAGAGTGGTAGGAGGAPAGGTAGGAGGTPVPCQAPIQIGAGTAATVTINLGVAPGPTVSGDLFGVHTAVYDTDLSLLARPTLATLLEDAGVTSLRYPGGSYGDVYFWESHAAYTLAPAQGAGSNVITLAPGTDFGNFVSLLAGTGANAFITVNYGSRPDGMGSGVPEEAAAWVAYANALPSNTTVIGVDASGRNWGTAGDWARLRAASPITPDDGRNLLRIAHPDPIGVRYWEIGNEQFGNGFYHGTAIYAGWEVDLHVPYNGTNGTARRNNPLLSGATYGAGVRSFSAKMKAVDPTIKIGAVLNWPVAQYAGWDTSVLQQACNAIDFGVIHWYPGTSVVDLLTRAGADVPAIARDLRALFTAANGCTTATPTTAQLAVTEWAPNEFTAEINAAINPTPPAVQTRTQIAGIYVAEAFARFMEQGFIAGHFKELHESSSGIDFLDAADVRYWGYHGLQIARRLAGGGETVVATSSSLATLLSHAVSRPDGGVNVMLTNISATEAASVTVSLAGGSSALACAGSRHAYTPAPGSTDLDGQVSPAQPIFSTPDGASVPVGVPPYSVVVVSFPRR